MSTETKKATEETFEEAIEKGVFLTWQDRLKDEYWQLAKKIDKLHRFIIGTKVANTDGVDENVLKVMESQEAQMRAYADCLIIRAKLCRIEL